MKLNCFFALFFIGTCISFAQTKVSGYVFDEANEPISYANVIFEGSTQGTMTNEAGKFYLESDETWSGLIVSFIGYETVVVALDKKVNYNLKFTLKEAVSQLNEVFIVSGKQPKKNNPAIDLLRKIWEHKRSNGLNQVNQYEYDKYEKLEFDINTIDSTLVHGKLFKGMEFVFDEVDTSKVTGKTYLPIFINEAVYKVYGDNVINKNKSVLEGNKNSGFSDNQIIIDFVKDLYIDINVYDNYLKIFDKSFVSPLSRTGIDVYNYVLADSSYIDNNWCYKVIYYPRRKNELTFKGDFWVADTTYAIKEINLQASKSANLNWIKEVHIEQEFEVLNDSLFLIKRDYMMSDFALNKKEESRGLYGKRTTVYNNYKFDLVKDKKFYEKQVNSYDKDVFDRDNEFWEKNRLEKLSEDEKGVYKMLDTLKTVKKFNSLYDLGTVLASGYYEFDKLPLDYGPIYSSFGYNDVEGIRVRTGGRTYFGKNDLWRIQGFLAYGFKDDKFKYGISGKWLIDKKNRLIVSIGNRRDIEQIGASLTNTADVLGRNFASSGIFSTAVNDKLTNINLTTLSFHIEPVLNLMFRLGGSYRTLESASPTFSLDFYDDSVPSGVSSEVKQYETDLLVGFFPKRKMSGFGVERSVVNDDYGQIYALFTKGFKGELGSSFDYSKVQFKFVQPWKIGGLGRLTTSVEAGKTFGVVPLGLLSTIPGNQSYFSVFNTFSQMDFYEFVTDTYTSVHLEHNFNGRIFSRIPYIKKYNLRAIVGLRGVIGDISEANKAINASGLEYRAPSEIPYYEYSFGVGNIFKVLRLDCNFRGNYLNKIENPEARDFGITASFGFYF